MTACKDSQKLLPTEPQHLHGGLSLHSRIKLLLTVRRSDASTKPLDEWQLKRSLIDFLKSHSSLTITESDLEFQRVKDLKKHKREDPIARGALLIRDLGFLSKPSGFKSFESVGGKEDEVKAAEKRLVEWRQAVVEKMDGMELNIVGVRFRLAAAVPAADDFEGMRKDWEEHYAFGSGGRGFSRGGRRQPDTIVLRGVPSRWFAEPRVSSKPSMLVTHEIFSAFGKIRNLDVGEDNAIGNHADDDSGDIVPGLQCKILVRFEKYRDFCDALKVLCGRSLQKVGSRLKADYEVTWDKDGFFQNSRTQAEERSTWAPTLTAGRYRSEAPRRQSHTRFSPDNPRSKRFKGLDLGLRWMGH
ncbi:hypothetical protein RJ639_047886 [Escallonia herrerae]|uniref:Uncharacterized protein n=1 Tax=Escallonia herrerae TaxID=1293975 RepID=A0AA89AZJ2_9ASTE|nr:hypothetical protein RJ639_047886 [Escallonia herrerae]